MCEPTSRIGASSTTVLVSTTAPTCASTAATMSAGPTEPYRWPDSAARAATVRTAGARRTAISSASARSRGPAQSSAAPHGFGLLCRAGRRLQGQALRNQVVAGEACCHIADVPLAAKPVHIRSQDDLHAPLPLAVEPPSGAGAVAGTLIDHRSRLDIGLAVIGGACRRWAGGTRHGTSSTAPAIAVLVLALGGHPVRVGARGPSPRASLMASATSFCCWALLPVTRRALILARSDMNLRSNFSFFPVHIGDPLHSEEAHLLLRSPAVVAVLSPQLWSWALLSPRLSAAS